MGQPRNNAIVPIYPNADHSGLEGYAVKIVAGKAALCNSLNDAPIGVIVEGGNGTTADSVALIGSGLGGTVLVRLAPSPGTVGLGTYLEITDDGDFKSDVGTAGTVCALALEAGSGRELIEAILLTNAGTVTLEQSYHTDIETDASGATLTVDGQVTDAGGNPLAGRFVVGVFLGEAANDGTPHDFGDLAAGSGSTIIREEVADAYAQVLTDADGSWSVELTLAGDDTVHVNAFVLGKVATDSAEVDVP